MIQTLSSLFVWLLAGLIQTASAQFNHLWSYSHYSNNNDEIKAIAAHDSGTVVTAGSFINTCIFDGDGPSLNLTSAGGKDVSLASYQADGTLNFVIGFGGSSDDVAADVVLDADGNIYVTGSFQNSMDVDPGAGEFILEASGLNDVFLIKYNALGELVWAHRFGEDFTDDGKELVLGDDGFLYMSGGYRIEMKFAGVADSITLSNPGFTTDVFLAKFNLDGEAVWARSFGGGGSDFVDGLAYWNDMLFLTGDFTTTIDLDASAAVDNHSSNGLNDVFLCAYDTDGDYLWGHTFGGSSADFGHDLATDNDGNIYMTGNFNNTINFSSTGGSLELTSALQSDMFLAAYTAFGDDLWAIRAGGSDAEEGYAVAVSASGPVVTGTFGSTVDFDPGPGTWEQTSAGFYDIYLVQYDFDGALIEAGNMGSPYSDYGHVLTMAPNGDILTGGRMQSPLDIDPGPGEILLYGNTGFDGYIARYNTCISYFLEESATICAGETYDFHGTVLSEAGEYVASFTTVDGCDSTFELSLVIHDIDITITSDDTVLNAVYSPDYSYQWLDCNDGMTPVEGATEAVFSATESGSYAVEITWGPCSEISACVTVDIEEPVGFSEELHADWLLWNGLNNWIISSDQPAQVQVFDMQGQAVYNSTINGTTELSTGQLAAGWYILKYSTDLYQDSRKILVY